MEKTVLKDCEKILEAGLSTFFEVGCALLTVREKELYRGNYRNFEDYCRRRWGISRSYAWRVLGAAERIKLLPASGDVPKPENEFQIRPFLKLGPAAFPNAWIEATKRARNGRVTPDIAKRLVAQLSPSANKVPRLQRAENRRVSFGKILVLLTEAKSRILKCQGEQAVAALDEIERLLFAR